MNKYTKSFVPKSKLPTPNETESINDTISNWDNTDTISQSSSSSSTLNHKATAFKPKPEVKPSQTTYKDVHAIQYVPFDKLICPEFRGNRWLEAYVDII